MFNMLHKITTIVNTYKQQLKEKTMIMDFVFPLGKVVVSVYTTGDGQYERWKMKEKERNLKKKSNFRNDHFTGLESKIEDNESQRWLLCVVDC